MHRETGTCLPRQKLDDPQLWTCLQSSQDHSGKLLSPSPNLVNCRPAELPLDAAVKRAWRSMVVQDALTALLQLCRLPALDGPGTLDADFTRSAAYVTGRHSFVALATTMLSSWCQSLRVHRAPHGWEPQQDEELQASLDGDWDTRGVIVLPAGLCSCVALGHIELCWCAHLMIQGG